MMHNVYINIDIKPNFWFKNRIVSWFKMFSILCECITIDNIYYQVTTQKNINKNPSVLNFKL